MLSKKVTSLTTSVMAAWGGQTLVETLSDDVVHSFCEFLTFVRQTTAPDEQARPFFSMLNTLYTHWGTLRPSILGQLVKIVEQQACILTTLESLTSPSVFQLGAVTDLILELAKENLGMMDTLKSELDQYLSDLTQTTLTAKTTEATYQATIQKLEQDIFSKNQLINQLTQNIQHNGRIRRKKGIKGFGRRIANVFDHNRDKLKKHGIKLANERSQCEVLKKQLVDTCDAKKKIALPTVQNAFQALFKAGQCLDNLHGQAKNLVTDLENVKTNLDRGASTENTFQRLIALRTSERLIKETQIADLSSKIDRMV